MKYDIEKSINNYFEHLDKSKNVGKFGSKVTGKGVKVSVTNTNSDATSEMIAEEVSIAIDKVCSERNIKIKKIDIECDERV